MDKHKMLLVHNETLFSHQNRGTNFWSFHQGCPHRFHEKQRDVWLGGQEIYLSLNFLLTLPQITRLLRRVCSLLRGTKLPAMLSTKAFPIIQGGVKWQAGESQVEEAAERATFPELGSASYRARLGSEDWWNGLKVEGLTLEEKGCGNWRLCPGNSVMFLL